MAEAGSMLGSGSIIVADDAVSIPHMALRTARFYHHESCGKCTPCREGTNWTVKVLERVVRGEATPMDLDIIASVQENIMGNCLCVLGDSMAMPVSAMVRKFRNEFEQVIAEQSPAPPHMAEAEGRSHGRNLFKTQPAAGPGHDLTLPGPAAGPTDHAESPS
jgi:NADH-quinone oxidoreductase subunit F